MKLKVIIASLAIIMSVGIANAQTQKTPQPKPQTEKKACFKDANKNNVCDNFEDGSCKICSKGEGTKTSNKEGRKDGKQNGQKTGSGNSNGGKSKLHIDSDNNGVCDRHEVK